MTDPRGAHFEALATSIRDALDLLLCDYEGDEVIRLDTEERAGSFDHMIARERIRVLDWLRETIQEDTSGVNWIAETVLGVRMPMRPNERMRRAIGEALELGRRLGCSEERLAHARGDLARLVALARGGAWVTGTYDAEKRLESQVNIVEGLTVEIAALVASLEVWEA